MSVYKNLQEKYNKRANYTDEEIYFKSGSYIFDLVISNGKGIPVRKFIQITSPSGLGKSTMSLHMCKYRCSMGKHVVYIDTEGGVNKEILDGIGLTKYIENNQFHLFQIKTFEQAEEILQEIFSDTDLGLVVIDSITSMLPGKLLDKSIKEVEIGLNARYASAFLSKFKYLLTQSESECSVIFINQMRTKFSGFNATVGEAGGKAQEYEMDIRVMMKKQDNISRATNTPEGKKEVPFGANALIWTLKNRFAQPFVELTITILYGRGVSDAYAYFKILNTNGLIKMGGGGHYTINIPNCDEIKARGMMGVLKTISDNSEKVIDYINSLDIKLVNE